MSIAMSSDTNQKEMPTLSGAVKKNTSLVLNVADMGHNFIRNLAQFGQRLAETLPILGEYSGPDASREQLAHVMSLLADRVLDRGSQERQEMDLLFRAEFKSAGVSLLQQEKVLRNPWFWVFQALAIRARARAISSDLEEMDMWFRTGQAAPFNETDGIIGEIFDYFQQAEPGMEICAQLLSAAKLI